MIDMCRGGRPITRAELASELADTLSRFMEVGIVLAGRQYHAVSHVLVRQLGLPLRLPMTLRWDPVELPLTERLS